MTDSRADYFDANLDVDCEAPGDPPRDLCGALLFGSAATAARDAWSATPRGTWRSTVPLRHPVGPGDPRFPTTKADVLDLQLSPDDLLSHLKSPPSSWWSLCGPTSGVEIIRFSLPPGVGCVKGLRILAEIYPRMQFLLDPFRHGLEAGWQGHVRLAEHRNVWLTTLGLNRLDLAQAEAVREAFHFCIGEVGAGKLLYASGAPARDAAPFDPAAWLSAIPCLDAAQRELILRENARELFELPADEPIPDAED